MQPTAILEDGRSVEIDASDFKAFKKKLGEFRTKQAASRFFGLSTITLDAIELKGTCKPSSLVIIKEKLVA